MEINREMFLRKVTRYVLHCRVIHLEELCFRLLNVRTEASTKSSVGYFLTRIPLILVPQTGLSRLNYTPASDLDYGTISCWARNSIDSQKAPCVFQIVAAGELAHYRGHWQFSYVAPPTNCWSFLRNARYPISLLLFDLPLWSIFRENWSCVLVFLILNGCHLTISCRLFELSPLSVFGRMANEILLITFN